MAVTVTYLSSGTGAVAPSVAAAQNFNTLVATVVASAVGDTSAAITHNFGLPASDISSGYPLTVLTPQGDPTSGAWFLSSQAPNFTILQKNTSAAGPQILATVSRPHTIFR